VLQISENEVPGTYLHPSATEKLETSLHRLWWYSCKWPVICVYHVLTKMDLLLAYMNQHESFLKGT
jgi:hypothetical protein